MWPDNETEKDFLNFSGVAGTVAEIITQATGRPTSIGISGSWGAGKSSMIKLVRAALAEKDQNDPEQFIYVEFNAWLYPETSLGSGASHSELRVRDSIFTQWLRVGVTALANEIKSKWNKLLTQEM